MRRTRLGLILGTVLAAVLLQPAPAWAGDTHREEFGRTLGAGWEVAGFSGDPVASLRGGTMTIGEQTLVDGSVGMAAPLFREDGIVGAIAVLGPAFRCDEAWRARTGRLLQRAARAINEELAEDRFG